MQPALQRLLWVLLALAAVCSVNANEVFVGECGPAIATAARRQLVVQCMLLSITLLLYAQLA
jgi:hypothetical protein